MAKKHWRELFSIVKECKNDYLVVKVTFQVKDKYGFWNNEGEHYEMCRKDPDNPKAYKNNGNRFYTYGKTPEEIENIISAYNQNKVVLYTIAERKKYVSLYNRKNGWGFNKNTLLATMRMHQKGDAKMKMLMEDRLEDANFHGYCGDLAENDYGGFMQRIERELKLGYL